MTAMMHSARFAPLLTGLLAALLLAGRSLAAQEAAALRSSCPSAEAARACFMEGMRAAHTALMEKRAGGAGAHLPAALRLLREICALGMPDACYFAGRLLVTTVADTSSVAVLWDAQAEAAELYERGCVARGGSGDACNGLGDSYAFGIGRRRNLDSAMVYFRRGCEFGNQTACFREAARFKEIAELGPLWAQMADRQQREACRGGSPGGCASVAYATDTALSTAPAEAHQTAGYRARAATLLNEYRRLCDGGRGQLFSCEDLGRVFEFGKFGFNVDLDSAFHYYQIGCRGVKRRSGDNSWLGKGSSCSAIADAGRSAQTRDTGTIAFFYRTACDLYEADACVDLGRKVWDPLWSPDNSFESLFRFLTACAEGSGYGCNNAGWVMERHRLFADTVEARRLYHRSCDMDQANGCANAGTLAEVTHGDVRNALRYYRRGCEMGYAYPCGLLGDLISTYYPGSEGTKVAYARACEYGDAVRCWAAARAYRAEGDEIQEGLYLSRACQRHEAFCKRKYSSSYP